MKIEGATTIEQYIAWFTQEEQAVLKSISAMIEKVIPIWYQMEYRWWMITREVPLERYPETYNKQPLAFTALARQKNNYALYLSALYMWDNSWRTLVEEGFKRLWKKPDMWKSCIRFKSPADIPLEEILQSISACNIDEFIAIYEKGRGIN